MGAIIRAGEAARWVRSAPLAKRPTDARETQLNLERELQERAFADLEARVLKQETKLAELPAALEAALEKGREEGRAEGLKQADDATERKLALLAGGVDGAIDMLEGHLAEFDRLAVLLAQTALERVLGDKSQFNTLIPEIVREQMARLAEQTVLRLEVSTADFSDPDAMASLSIATGRSQVDVQALQELKSGDCRIILQLGAIQVGPTAQWEKLRALFDHALEIGSER